MTTKYKLRGDFTWKSLVEFIQTHMTEEQQSETVTIGGGDEALHTVSIDSPIEHDGTEPSYTLEADVPLYLSPEEFEQGGFSQDLIEAVVEI